MHPDIAIQVENVSKVYPLRQAHADGEGNLVHEHWALNDVSFAIRKGETVGIIGPNGSGKSTLLKILAGVTKPASGKVCIRGKVASILDVGAGFHLELSGRENVFLNGQLFGFARKEILKHYKDIVEFSGIGEFIEEPVKNYSNGMYLRLAFSIMAHLNFDVYLFDEVMSVGDADFSRKAAERIRLIEQTNKTVLIVSHSFEELERVGRTLTFDHGKLVDDAGSAATGLLDYAESSLRKSGDKIHEQQAEITDFYRNRTHQEIRMEKIKLHQPGEPLDAPFRTDKPFALEVTFETFDAQQSHDFALVISDYKGTPILNFPAFVYSTVPTEAVVGMQKITCTIPATVFYPKVYSISIYFVRDGHGFMEKIMAAKSDPAQLSEEVAKLEYTLLLDNVLYFKPTFIKNGQVVDVGLFNFKGQMLVHLDHEKTNG